MRGTPLITANKDADDAGDRMRTLWRPAAGLLQAGQSPRRRNMNLDRWILRIAFTIAAIAFLAVYILLVW